MARATAGRSPSAPAGPPTRDSYTVGQLAAELGVTTRTLRFYEEAGIVTPARTASGSARVYTARDRARLVLALRGKRFGMSLAEIREIVDMYDAEPGEAGQIRRLLASLETLRTDLLARQSELARTLAEVDDVSRRCTSRLAELAAAPAPRAPRPRTSAPSPATGPRSGRVTAGAVARGGTARASTAPPSPASGAKSR
jgi:DNA-binding transcriptional MerR regulator